MTRLDEIAKQLQAARGICYPSDVLELLDVGACGKDGNGECGTCADLRHVIAEAKG